MAQTFGKWLTLRDARQRKVGARSERAALTTANPANAQAMRVGVCAPYPSVASASAYGVDRAWELRWVLLNGARTWHVA